MFLWVFCIIALGVGVPSLLIVASYLRSSSARTRSQRENARRQKAHGDSVDAALRAAAPVKAAQDHRLRIQLRELEGLAKTAKDKETEVSRILASLA